MKHMEYIKREKGKGLTRKKARGQDPGVDHQGASHHPMYIIGRATGKGLSRLLHILVE
jgi:hypothetical protein